MVLVTTDQIGHFLKPLVVFGNTPNLRVGFWNLPFFYIYIILKGKDCTLISAWCSISNYCTILQRILIWINHLHFFYALYKDMERQKIYQFILSSARGGK